MKITSWTHLGREFHPRYMTHRRVILIGLLALIWGALVAGLRGSGGFPAAWAGAATALAAFLAWAIGRELDPDHAQSAILAGVASAALQPWLGPASLGGLAWFLITARIVNGSTGLPPKGTDMLAHFTIAAAAAWTGGALLAAVSGLAVALGAVIHQRPRWHIGAALLNVAAAVTLASRSGWMSGAQPDILPALLFGAGLLAASWFVGKSGAISTTGDYGTQPLARRGVQAAFALAALLLWMDWIRAQGEAVVSWFPLWAAVLATLLYRPFSPRGRSTPAKSPEINEIAHGQRPEENHD